MKYSALDLIQMRQAIGMTAGFGPGHVSNEQQLVTAMMAEHTPADLEALITDEKWHTYAYNRHANGWVASKTGREVEDLERFV